MCRFIEILCCCLLFQFLLVVDAFSIFRRRSEVGSREIFAAACSCRSVEVWMNQSPSTELPSYQDVTPSFEMHDDVDENLGKHLRLYPQKHCKLLVHKDKLSHSWQDKIITRPDGSVEVILKKRSNCVSFWMDCKERSYCVGIDFVTNDVSQSTRRKLLMVLPDRNQELLPGNQGVILLSGFVLCAMVILIALCGSSPRKRSQSQEVYTGEGEVKVISSEKIQTIPRGYPECGAVNEELSGEKQERVCEKPAEDHVIGRNNNSNNPSPNDKPSHNTDVDGALNGVDEASAPVGADTAITNAGKDKMDGQVLGKENNDKKEKGKRKKKSKDETQFPPSRANTSSAVTLGATPIGKSKGRFFLKAKSFTSIKLEKNKKSKSQEDLTRDSLFAEQQGIKFPLNRRSFVSRELPQLPGGNIVTANDESYAEPFDRKQMQRPVSQHDFEVDDNYEVVSNRVRSGRIVSAKDEVRHTLRHPSSSNAHDAPRIGENPGEVFDQDIIQTDTYDEVLETTKGTLSESKNISEPQNVTVVVEPDVYDEVLETTKRTFSESKNVTDEPDVYDEVLETTKASEPADDNIELDTYEEVPHSTKSTLPGHVVQTDGFYESVGNAHSSAVYEDPKERRLRSASADNFCIKGVVKTESERKSLSLPHGKALGPEPPTLDNLKAVITSQMSRDSDKLLQDIEPYTITKKKGDYIIQENSSPTFTLPVLPAPQKPDETTTPLTAAEIDTLYSKVDKVKQKKDREEMGKDGEIVDDISDCEDTNYETVPTKRLPQNNASALTNEEQSITFV